MLRKWIPLLPSLLLLLIGLLVSKAHGQTLIVEFSDSHSAYDRLPNFLKSVQTQIADFRRQNPQGQAVILVNGDFSGLSAWATESGWLGIKALEHLNRMAPVLFVLGNHDGFDWSDHKQGNSLVAQQMARLSQVGVTLLGSNIEFAENLRPLLKPHYDLSVNGKQIRFAALGLENFFVKSNWMNDPKNPILHRMHDSVDTMERIVTGARHEGTDAVIFFQHDGHQEVSERIEKLQARLHTLGGPQIPVVFAAHDHEIANRRVGPTQIVDSRSNFDFSTVVLDRELRFASTQFWDEAKQASTALRAQKGPEAWERFVKVTENFVAKARVRSSEVLVETGGFEDFKLTLKSGPRPLGTALAESLRAWGAQEAERLGYGKLPVVAFYNSSSYRRDDPVKNGQLTRGDVAGFYPFPGEVMMFDTNIKEVERLFADLRQWRLQQDGKYTPQLSTNLAESAPFRLKLKNAEGERVILVLDSWLSRNRYAIPSFDQFLIRHQALTSSPHQQLLEKFAPGVFARLSPPAKSCRSVHR